jgi:hypothetical protein
MQGFLVHGHARKLQHPLMTHLVICALLAFADRGMMAKVDMILEGIIGVERL